MTPGLEPMEGAVFFAAGVLVFAGIAAAISSVLTGSRDYRIWGPPTAIATLTWLFGGALIGLMGIPFAGVWGAVIGAGLAITWYRRDRRRRHRTIQPLTERTPAADPEPPILAAVTEADAWAALAEPPKPDSQAPPLQAVSRSSMDRLRELDALREAGIIDGDEYAAKRAKIIDEI